MMVRKKVLPGDIENDPEWVQNIGCYFLTTGEDDKSDECKKNLHDLFLEYRIEGMEPNKAWKKAKKVLDCFGT